MLKPIGYSDFLRAAEKYRERFEPKYIEKSQVESNDEYLFIKSEYKIIRINLSEIKYVEGMREYVRIHLENQKTIMALMSMKKLEGYLPENSFMRVHRSFIVNPKKVSTVERFRIVFDEKVFIPVSEQYKQKFQDFLNKNFLL